MIPFFRHHKIFGGVVTSRKQAALSIHLVYKPVRFVCARTGPQLSVFFSLDMGMFYFRFVLLTFGLYIITNALRYVMYSSGGFFIRAIGRRTTKVCKGVRDFFNHYLIQPQSYASSHSLLFCLWI